MRLSGAQSSRGAELSILVCASSPQRKLALASQSRQKGRQDAPEQPPHLRPRVPAFDL